MVMHKWTYVHIGGGSSIENPLNWNLAAPVRHARL